MRIWTLHPSYLDSKGLVALWRETLLAQNVLLGNTKGYKNHPQLIRFKNTTNPISAIGKYLKIVALEADKRKYSFNKTKIKNENFEDKITVTTGQLNYEFKHLLSKLKIRDITLYKKFKDETTIKIHPIFKVLDGDIQEWEKV